MGGSSQAPKVNQTSQYIMSDDERGIFNMTLPYIKQWASNPLQMFSGSRIAGINPLEQQAQEGYLSSAAPAAQNLVSRQAATQAQLLDPNFMLNPNQYVNAAADATRNVTTQNLMENILPTVRGGNIASSGMYSGGASRGALAEGKAIGDTNRALSDNIANMFYGNYSTGLSHLGAAVDRTPAVAAAQLFPHDIFAAVGGQRRAEEQARLDEEVQNFYTARDLPLMQGQQLLQLLGGMRFGTQVGEATGAVPQSNPLMSMLGLGASALGYGMGGPIGGMLGKGAASGMQSLFGGGK